VVVEWWWWLRAPFCGGGGVVKLWCGCGVLLEVLQSGGAGEVDVLVLVRFCSLRFGAFNFDGPATPYPLWWWSGVSVLFGGVGYGGD
jgi:hypothetical protein